jgi:hypothetical protein
MKRLLLAGAAALVAVAAHAEPLGLHCSLTSTDPKDPPDTVTLQINGNGTWRDLSDSTAPGPWPMTTTSAVYHLTIPRREVAQYYFMTDTYDIDRITGSVSALTVTEYDDGKGRDTPTMSNYSGTCVKTDLTPKF